MGSCLVRPVSLRHSDQLFSSLLLSLALGVFSIRSALRVTSQNRIFANAVYRQFPAPDSNRLASLLPRRTVKSCLLAFRIFVGLTALGQCASADWLFQFRPNYL